MAASAEITDGDHHDAVELIVCDAAPLAQAPEPDGINGDCVVSASEEITPLLRPKINIFSVSRSRRKPREKVIKVLDTETSPVIQFILWVWGGSRYSGLLCVAVASTIYFLMGVLSDIFSAQSIPLFETAFTRCTITLILSYLWLRRSGQTVFGPAHARKFLFSRALTGCLSLLGFIYCIQRLPLSQAIVLSSTTPIMASIAARVMLHEKLKISDLGGLACSFFGVLFIFRQILSTQGDTNSAYVVAHFMQALVRVGEANAIVIKGSNHLFAVFVGLFSSMIGGISYCLIKSGANASEQPVVTVLSFGLLTSPVTGICIFAFEEFVLPDFYSFILILILGILSFFAEVFLARGLQLEKTSKATNVLFMEAALSQIWAIGSWKVTPSFGGLVGCLLILISVCCTIYIGPDKEIE